MAKIEAKFSVRSDGFEGFAKRVREHAAAMDRGASIASEITITLSSPLEMRRLLTPKRTELLEILATKGSRSTVRLATDVRRSESSVNRDLKLLRSVGAVELHSTHTDKRQVTMASASAERYEFVSSFGR